MGSSREVTAWFVTLIFAILGGIVTVRGSTALAFDVAVETTPLEFLALARGVADYGEDPADAPRLSPLNPALIDEALLEDTTLLRARRESEQQPLILATTEALATSQPLPSPAQSNVPSLTTTDAPPLTVSEPSAPTTLRLPAQAIGSEPPDPPKPTTAPTAQPSNPIVATQPSQPVITETTPSPATTTDTASSTTAPSTTTDSAITDSSTSSSTGSDQTGGNTGGTGSGGSTGSDTGSGGSDDAGDDDEDDDDTGSDQPGGCKNEKPQEKNPNCG